MIPDAGFGIWNPRIQKRGADGSLAKAEIYGYDDGGFLLFGHVRFYDYEVGNVEQRRSKRRNISNIGPGMMAYCIALGTFWKMDIRLPSQGLGGSRAWATEPRIRDT